MFSSMLLRHGEKFLFAGIAEFIRCNDIYNMNERQLIPFQYFE